MWDSPESNFTASAQATALYNKFEKNNFKDIATSPSCQRVNGENILISI